MNNELSQAERTARKTARDTDAHWAGRGCEEEFEKGWLAARDYYTDPSYCISCGGPCRDESPDPLEQSEERERALADALKGMIAITELPGTRSELSPQTERAKSMARAALAVSQSEVLSERNDTEPGEPGGSAITTFRCILSRRTSVSVLVVARPSRTTGQEGLATVGRLGVLALGKAVELIQIASLSFTGKARTALDGVATIIAHLRDEIQAG